jgi:3-oxoadipate enol-lactonase / 4-carboxymuconolactone decarboxylase
LCFYGKIAADVAALSRPERSSPPGVLAFADRVLTERGEPSGRLYYAGDSLRGAVGLQALLDAPERIVAAVLLCTGAKIGDAEGWRERAARVRASAPPP